VDAALFCVKFVYDIDLGPIFDVIVQACNTQLLVQYAVEGFVKKKYIRVSDGLT
jgi:hypothetical protein